MAQILDTLTLENYAPCSAALSALATLRSTRGTLAAVVTSAQSTYNSAVTAAADADERFVSGAFTAEERTALLAAVTSAQAALTSAQNDLSVCDNMVYSAIEVCRGASYGAEQAGVTAIASEWQTVVGEVATAHAALVAAIEAVGVYLSTLQTKLTGAYTAHGVVDRINGHLKTIAGSNATTVETTLELERLLVSDMKRYLDMPLNFTGKRCGDSGTGETRVALRAGTLTGKEDV